MIRIGVTLPTFRDDAKAVEAAGQAERLGFDGVFVFDHIWPLGEPERPSLAAFPVLGAVASSTERVLLGPFVARVGLVPDDVLVERLQSLQRISSGRLIAGLGTGDAKSAPENLAYGIPLGSADERRLALRRCAVALRQLGIPVWVGGGARTTAELAIEMGEGVALNLWDAEPSAIASIAPRLEVTWGGQLQADVPQVVRWLSELDNAGASWAVAAWPRSLKQLAEAKRVLGDGSERHTGNVASGR